MIDYETATAFFDDNLLPWVDALNWLYIDAPPWEEHIADHESNDLLGKPINLGEPYYQRRPQAEIEPIILSRASFKCLLFLLIFGNNGLTHAIKEDYPQADEKRQQAIVEGTYQRLNFHTLEGLWPELEAMEALSSDVMNQLSEADLDTQKTALLILRGYLNEKSA